MTTVSILLSAIVLGQVPEPTLHLSHCLVAPQEEALVPARAAGVLTNIDVCEGDSVLNEAKLGQIDDTLPQEQWRAAYRRWEAAHAVAGNDVSIRLAIASEAVAKADVEAADDANGTVAGTVPRSETRRLRLSHERTLLQIEQSRLDYSLQRKAANVRASEVAVAKIELQARQVISPLEGMVVEVFRHRGEWVQPGEPIFHVVRLDCMRVEGFISAAQLREQSLIGRPVSIRVSLPDRADEILTGELQFASPVVDANAQCRVWAKVNNRQVAGQWLLQPGSTVAMHIQLSE